MVRPVRAAVTVRLRICRMHFPEVRELGMTSEETEETQSTPEVWLQCKVDV